MPEVWRVPPARGGAAAAGRPPAARSCAPPLAALAAAVLGCADPCPPVEVLLPAARTSVPWTGSGYATVDVEVAGRPVAMVLDTGFPRSAISPAEAGGLDLGQARLAIGGAQAGPMPMGVLLSGTGPAGVVGSDVLHQVPIVFDARQRSTALLPAFGPASSEAVLGLVGSGRCGAVEADRRAPTFFVEVQVEGEAGAFILDTGAEATFVSSEAAARLADRPRLDGVRVSSGFAGTFAASATRARSLAIGSARVENAAVLSAAEVDAELARLTEAAKSGSCAAGGACPTASFVGFLGWNFLREFSVSLAEGEPFGARRLGLERFDEQGHVRRDFVGIGVTLGRSEVPAGLRVDGFPSVSPARDAGVQLGDVIITVNGQPAASVPTPFGAPGEAVRLGLRRGASSLELSAIAADLIPNPAP